MNCEKIKPHIPGYIDHELAEETIKEVELHLISCASCQKLRDAYLEDQKRVQKLKNLAVDPRFWQGYMAEIQEKLVAENIHREDIQISMITWATRMVLAATLLLGLYVWGTLKWSQERRIRNSGIQTTKNHPSQPSQKKNKIMESTLLVPEILQKGRADILSSKIPLMEREALRFESQKFKVRIVTPSTDFKKGSPNENEEMDF
ncbi:MAG: zf-HC2 domain-containing protein [Planctomycetota bacterium]|nr:MAG: zf-HC2 domain-containing protein [Planctomycetota bacterium]